MNENIPQLATIRIHCNGDIGTAVIYFPNPDVDYVYILTAKHCLTGKDFDKEYSKEKIILDKIFNEETSAFHSYNVTDTAIVITSADVEDMALLILPKSDIIALTGKQFFVSVIDTDSAISEYRIRGFANFNDQEKDRSFPLIFIEDQKENPSLFVLHSPESLDTYYQQAMENVGGLSGSGAYSCLHDNIYFTGIINSYEDGNIFTSTKVLAYNKLIPATKFQLITALKPETDPEILKSYIEMERNREAINQRTRETIGSINVPRDTTALLGAMTMNNLVVVHGNPGVGKSALSKSAVASLKSSGDHSIITFTAENLYCETLEEALKNAGYTVSIQQISMSPLSGRHTLIWIESFEKLIESGYYGAFNELLTLLNNNKQINAIITIREYLLQKFRINFYYELPKNTSYFQVNAFNEKEIELVQTSIPELAQLLENQKINHLLRNPYYLDKAARIIPFLIREEQLDEAKFKNLMWEHIVKAGKTIRGEIFYEICLKRAREMSLFTSYTENEDAINELVSENILQADQNESSNTYSPSHDILEDWALIRFINYQKKEMPDAKSFLLSMENTPAMRRAFRLWMEESYRLEPSSSVNFVHGLLSDITLPPFWKEELLVVSLRSDHAGILLDALKNQFLEDNGNLLDSIIFLLQTGCRRLDPLKQDFNHLLPIGSGWDYIIDFIWNNLSKILLLNKFEGKYLELIESWSQQLPEFNQPILPSGAKSAAYLLEDFIHRSQEKTDSYWHIKSAPSNQKHFIGILFKLTAADPSLIKTLIEALRDPQKGNERWTNTATLHAVRGFITDGVLTDQICRFFPDNVFQIAIESWSKKEKAHSSGRLHSMIHNRPGADDFGLEENLDRKYDIASGYQTFFYWMFSYHPERAIDFLIPFLNKAFDKNQQILLSLGHPIELITVRFEDNTENTYYGTFEYWSMFRGFGVRNRLIASLLMALESALLDLADKDDYETVQLYVKKLIKESNNVALIAVVISILQAHPNLLDDVSVSLLGIQAFYLWDSSRYSDEMHSNTVYNRDEFEKQERIRANSRIHRKKYYQGLIGFVADYMFYHQTYNELLIKQIDMMWKNAPEEDLLWKKFLYDMDARKYTFQPIDQLGYENYRQLIPDYDDDVKRNITENIESREDFPSVNSIWAKKALDNEIMPDHNYDTWKSGYEFIQSRKGFNFWTSPGAMATVGLRDFIFQLQPEELVWCSEIIIRAAEKKLNQKDPYAMDMDIFGKDAILSALPYLFKAKLDTSTKSRVKDLIFRLLLSGMDDRDRISLEAGIAHHLVDHEPDFVINCWYGLLYFISYKKDIAAEYERKRYNDWNDNLEEDITDDSRFEILIKSVVDGTITAPPEINTSLDMSTHWYLDDALRIIPWKTELTAHHLMIQQLLKLHVEFLNDPYQDSRYDYHDSRSAFIFFYPRYLLNQPVDKSKILFEEFLNLALENHERKNTAELRKFMYDLVKEFITAVNNGSPKENFWMLWDVLREWMLTHMNGLFIPLFLIDIDWTENSDNWQVLKDKSLYYKEFITTWGFNRINSSIKFLGGIAFHQFMPDSLTWILPMLGSQNAYEVNIKLLEKFTEKAFYKYGDNIKRDKFLLANLLDVLNFLIKKGSPKAYMLRDDLLQYK